jgi:hypothetical protein
MSKRTMQEYRRQMKQFMRDAQGTTECRLLTTAQLLFMKARNPPSAQTDAFDQWSATALKSRPGEGPLCLTCDAEFGPGRTAPAAFWFRSPYAKQSKLTVISGICPTCLTRPGCVDRIIAGMRNAVPTCRSCRCRRRGNDQGRDRVVRVVRVVTSILSPPSSYFFPKGEGETTTSRP